MEAKQPTAAGSGHGIEVLVLEDSPIQAVRLKLTLEQHGYQVTVARDGKQRCKTWGHRRARASGTSSKEDST
jgi:PleD family two-component response regulator